MHKNNYRGFTLIELLIVVAIIGILAAIAIPNFLEAQTRAKVARVKAEMKTISTAMEMYFVDHNRYIPCYFETYSGTYSPPWQYYYIWIVYGKGPGQADGAGKYLTTPISYLTSLPADGFTGQRGLDGSSFWYCYFGPAELSNRPHSGFLMGEIWSGNWNHPLSRKAAHWVMQSNGPDQRYSSNDSDPVYDPTNGTISEGDIWWINTEGLLGGA